MVGGEQQRPIDDAGTELAPEGRRTAADPRRENPVESVGDRTERHRLWESVTPERLPRQDVDSDRLRRPYSDRAALTLRGQPSPSGESERFRRLIRRAERLTGAAGEASLAGADDSEILDSTFGVDAPGAERPAPVEDRLEDEDPAWLAADFAPIEYGDDPGDAAESRTGRERSAPGGDARWLRGLGVAACALVIAGVVIGLAAPRSGPVAATNTPEPAATAPIAADASLSAARTPIETLDIETADALVDQADPRLRRYAQAAESETRRLLAQSGAAGRLIALSLMPLPDEPVARLYAEGWFALSDSACARRPLSFTVIDNAGARPVLSLRRIGAMRFDSCAVAPSARAESGSPARFADEAISTRSVERYLGGEALRRLVDRNPQRCIVEQSSADAPQGCVETTTYYPAAGRFVRTSALDGSATLEIRGAFEVRGDALCHDSADVTALVMNAAPDSEIAAIERAIEDSYRDLDGATICHRLRSVSAENGVRRYVADVFVDDRPAPSRFDPRPFELRVSS